MDLKRLTEWLGTAEGLGKALVALLGVLPTLWAATTKVLDDWIKPWGLPAWVPTAFATVVVTLFVVMLSHSYRRFARASRLEKPDAFVLRPTGPNDLIGRDGDLADLLKTVKSYRVVLLDGESGCGKSALAGAGLVRTLETPSTGLLPVLVRDWGDDWFSGPPAAVLGAAWQALSITERNSLDWVKEPDLAAATEELQSELAQRLSAIFSTLGRRPLLILDQFDDHQARHRDRFVDADGNWLRPSELISGTPFWATLTQALREDRLHLLVITRNDTAAGLACIDLLPERTARRTLHRVENLYLPQVLTQLAPDDAQPPVVSHPERGWHQLRQQLHTDLQTEGALLMQQLRTVLQGLRELPALTLRDYRRAGGLRGLEALFVTRALRRAAESARNAHGLPLAQARALLRALTQPGNANQAPKARRQNRAELDALADNPALAEQLLQQLAHENLIRPADATGQHHAAWQLDHDYLAKAVLAEARLANRWQTALEEGHIRYRQASGSWAAQWATLLPIGTQVRLWWEHARGRLPWDTARSYVRLSLLKPLTATLVMALAVWGGTWAYLDHQLSLEADRLINRLANDNTTSLDIWHARPALRDRVHDHIVADPHLLLTAVKAGWPLADVALDSRRVLRMAQALRSRMEAEKDRDFASNFAKSYASVTSRLSDQTTLLAAAQALRSRMEAEKDNFLTSNFADSYASVASRLSDQAALLAAAQALRSRMEAERDSDLASSFADSYASVVSRLRDQAALLAEAQALRSRMEAKNNNFFVTYFARSYANVTNRLSDQAALLAEAHALRLRMEAEKDSRLVTYFAYSYASVTSRLSDQAALLAEAQALRSRMEAEKDSRLASSFADSYASVASRLSDQTALLAEAQALRSRMEAEKDSRLASSFADSYARVASRLSDQAALLAAAQALRSRMEAEKDSFLASNFAKSYARVASRLSDQTTLLAAAQTLRSRMEAEKDSRLASSFANSYASVASRLSDQAALLAAAQALRSRMEAEKNSDLASNFAKSYASLASRLSDQAALLAEAQALRSRMKDSSLAAYFSDSYASVVSRLSDQAALLAEAQALRSRMKGSSLAAYFANSYTSVASRLSDQAALLAEAQALRSRMEAEKGNFFASNFAKSYASVAQRIAQLSAQAPAAQTREVLTLAGHPFIRWTEVTETDESPEDKKPTLLDVMETLAKRKFPGGIPEAVVWAEKTHGIKPETLLPYYLPKSGP